MLHFPRWKVIAILLICLLSIVVALPNFLPLHIVAKIPAWLPSSKVNLGLDLRGGSQLLLKIDFASYLKDQMEMLQDSMRVELRSKKIGYQNLRAHDSNITFDLRNSEDTSKIKSAIRKISTELEVNILANNAITVSYNEHYLHELRGKVVEQSIEIIRRRVDETGTKEPSIQKEGEENILLQVPGLDDPNHLKNMIGKTAKLTFHMVDENSSVEAALNGQVPAVDMLLAMETKTNQTLQYYLLKKKVVLNGDMLKPASTRTTILDNSLPAVQFSLNTIGTRQFAELTKQNVNHLMAIVLDNKIISVATIREHITGGTSVISGNFTVESANELSLLLRAGALPAPLTIVEERTVGPNLGADSIESGKKAGIVGIILIMVFMILTYGLPGMFANLALLVNMVLIIAALSLLQATLTMPGIAGIILTMGMAVDANVLIFERIREETKAGSTSMAATERGFKQAFSTILDSNLTTIIVAILLYIFGSGVIKGFGVTLTIGIVSSMFSAITLTRLMIASWLKIQKPARILG